MSLCIENNDLYALCYLRVITAELACCGSFLTVVSHQPPVMATPRASPARAGRSLPLILSADSKRRAIEICHLRVVKDAFAIHCLAWRRTLLMCSTDKFAI